MAGFRDWRTVGSPVPVGERRYSLGGWNCEHFVTWRAIGVADSQQVVGTVAGYLVIIKAAIGAGSVMLVVMALKAALAE